MSHMRLIHFACFESYIFVVCFASKKFSKKQFPVTTVYKSRTTEHEVNVKHFDDLCTLDKYSLKRQIEIIRT